MKKSLSFVLFVVFVFGQFATVAFAANIGSSDLVVDEAKAVETGPEYMGPFTMETNDEELVEVYGDPADSDKCGSVPNKSLSTVNFYRPQFPSDVQTYKSTVKMGKATYMCMKTSLRDKAVKANGGFAWVAMPPNSKVGYTASGHAYYLGAKYDNVSYLSCHNRILAIFTFKEEEDYEMGGKVIEAKATAKATATATATATACVPTAEWTEVIIIGKDGKPYKYFTDGCNKTNPLLIPEKEAKKKGWSTTKKVVVVGVIVGGSAALIYGLSKLFKHKDHQQCSTCPVNPIKNNSTVTASGGNVSRPRNKIQGFSGEYVFSDGGGSSSTPSVVAAPATPVKPPNCVNFMRGKCMD